MPTVKVPADAEKEVTVRQVPLTEMESPSWQSDRISAALEIVNVVPPSAEFGLSSVTSVQRLTTAWRIGMRSANLLLIQQFQ
jgi:hypothetical protein